MTERDKSASDVTQRLQQQLRDAGEQSPSQQAKSDAMAAAMAAFDAVPDAERPPATKSVRRRQGFFRRLRPTRETNHTGRNAMHTFNQRWMYSGAATAGVLLIAVTVAYRLPLDQNAALPALDMSEVQPKPSLKRDDSLTASPPVRQEDVASADVADVASMAPPVAEEREAMAGKAKAERKLQAVPMAPATSAPAPARLKEAFADMRSAGRVMEADTRMPVDPPVQPGYQDIGRDDFETIADNPVQRVSAAPVSTFSIDVDTASYSFVRRQLNQGVLPQKDAVRLEEMVNYFDYAYPLPTSRQTPFSTDVMVTASPWRSGNKLVRIGIKGYELSAQSLPRTNLVFLLDVSGSMNSPDKLPLVKQSMELLLSQLDKDDRVAIAVYAGAAGTVLPPTPASDTQTILDALNRLEAGGSTAGGAGIKLAYQLAAQHLDKQAVNRVVLATDGDFNVGITDREELKGFVEREREKGIYLSVLGFGQGNYHDHLMQELAQNGNGVAAYIDTLAEAQKVLVNEATSSLFPIAQDVKIQVEFNPATVSEYRLLGYETRALAREDFSNDAVDAGDIGAGHTVTALYEITPVGEETLIEASRYQSETVVTSDHSNEYAFLRLRYKLPGEKVSKLIEQPITADTGTRADNDVALRETRFATAVAGFAQLLRGGKYTGDWDFDDVLSMAQANKGDDPFGYRTEFVQLVRRAKTAKSL